MSETVKNFLEQIRNHLNEETTGKMVLYRGVEDKSSDPRGDNYAFFAADQSFAEDYGQFVWRW